LHPYRLAAQINAGSGGRALAVVADAGEKPDLERLVNSARGVRRDPYRVQQCRRRGGPCPRRGVWGNTDAVWKTAMDVNVVVTWRLTELTEADMQAHGRGSIISVQSCGGLTPMPPAVAYGVSKAGLLFLVRELASRCAQIAARAQAFAQRTSETGWADAG
jgi:gluconate 5-dehydrogenase/7-alpha-hydroxysteroid dehydrogenase